VEGEVLARRGPDVLRHYGPGDVVLSASSFAASTPAWDARAIGPTRVMSFPLEFWFDLMAEHFDLVRATIAALWARRNVLIQHLARQTPDVVLT